MHQPKGRHLRFLLKIGSLNSPTTKHLMDVGSLSCRTNLESVLTALHYHIRIFHSLIDAPPSAPLAGSFLLPGRAIRHCHVPHKYLNE